MVKSVYKIYFLNLFSSCSGWLIHHREKENLSKTVVTYLPPINAKVNEFTTIITYLEYLQTVAGQANMKYVNVTLDVGAAVNAYKTVWHYPRKFNNIIIHLSFHFISFHFYFHFMKENFQVKYRNL